MRTSNLRWMRFGLEHSLRQNTPIRKNSPSYISVWQERRVLQISNCRNTNRVNGIFKIS